MSAPGVCDVCGNAGFIVVDGHKLYCACLAGNAARIFNEAMRYVKEGQRDARVAEYLKKQERYQEQEDRWE